MAGRLEQIQPAINELRGDRFSGLTGRAGGDGVLGERERGTDDARAVGVRQSGSQCLAAVCAQVGGGDEEVDVAVGDICGAQDCGLCRCKGGSIEKQFERVSGDRAARAKADANPGRVGRIRGIQILVRQPRRDLLDRGERSEGGGSRLHERQRGARGPGVAGLIDEPCTEGLLPVQAEIRACDRKVDVAVRDIRGRQRRGIPDAGRGERRSIQEQFHAVARSRAQASESDAEGRGGHAVRVAVLSIREFRGAPFDRGTRSGERSGVFREEQDRGGRALIACSIGDPGRDRFRSIGRQIRRRHLEIDETVGEVERHQGGGLHWREIDAPEQQCHRVAHHGSGGGETDTNDDCRNEFGRVCECIGELGVSRLSGYCRSGRGDGVLGERQGWRDGHADVARLIDDPARQRLEAVAPEVGGRYGEENEALRNFYSGDGRNLRGTERRPVDEEFGRVVHLGSGDTHLHRGRRGGIRDIEPAVSKFGRAIFSRRRGGGWQASVFLKHESYAGGADVPYGIGNEGRDRLETVRAKIGSLHHEVHDTGRNVCRRHRDVLGGCKGNAIRKQ